MLDSKNSAIKDLQYELARVCKVNIMGSIMLNRVILCSFDALNNLSCT